MIKNKIKENKRLVIIISGIIGIALIVLTILLLVKGCSNKLTIEQKKLKEASIKTSIGSEGLDSYRAKISIRGKGSSDINKNYIVYNYKNKEFNISIFDGKENTSVSIKKGEKNKQLKYDYTDTNLFLKGLEKGNDIKTRKEKIGEEEYTIYEFNIEKSVINDMLKPFNISNKSDGTGNVYIDSKGNIYLVIYDTDDINISASYTRLNDIK